ncbi:MAG: DNA polymerase III subunit alpha, partial [Bdellovibrionota bacterium]
MPTNADFVHCHLHTEYSFLDGANKISRLMERASEYKMSAISMTDHGNLCGAIEFYKEAKESGIKPIIGCEVYVAPGSRTDRSGKAHYTNHLILLAKNKTGYKNLCKLTSSGYLEGFYYRPRIDKEILKEHSEGLIGLSACLKGEVSYLLSQGQNDAAKKAALDFKNIFEPGHFHLEIQENGLDMQKQVNAHMCELSKDTGIPLAATADCHYLNADDALAHKVLMYIGMNKNLAPGEQVETDLHFKGGELVWNQFSYAPQAIERTLWIAEQCNLELEMGSFRMPKFEPPGGVNVDAYFMERARKGLSERIDELKAFGRPLSPERVSHYQERLEHEIGVIRRMGFPGYFLIVADFIQYAKNNKIPVGPGRGSAAGSLVAWALRITEVDPLPYGLVFERFLNEGRKSMPDIDVDFCMDRRGEVINYISQKYGGDGRVAQIITYGKLKAKAVIRDVARVLGLPYADADRLAKLIPNRDPSQDNPLNVTLNRALEMEPRIEEEAEKNPQIAQLLDLAKRLEGLNRHAGMHAAGIVIGDDSFTDVIPRYKADDAVTTQYDMGNVEALGYVKFDFLGLKTLTMIRHAERLVRESHDPKFDMQRISLEDKAVYDRLGQGDNIGVFQLESGGMRDTMLRLKPRSIEEISDILALYRPGPM